MIDLKLVHEHTKNLHILYVEDNETLRESTLKVLNNFFDVVDVAVDGLDGVDKYKTFFNAHEKPYDLVVSDINMPHLNGVEMSKKILELDPHQSIIFITAHNEPEFLHQAISLGVSSFLLKPLNLQDLASVLFNVCRSISDRKIVQEHYEMMEEVNQQLENQNEALALKNKEQAKLIRVLDTMMAVKAHTNKVEHVEVQTPENKEKEESYYEQIQLLIEEDITELQEIHEALDADIISIIAGRDEYISNLPELFSRYASILGMYSSFEALSGAMSNLVHAIYQEEQPKNPNNHEEIFNFLEAFMYILGRWQKDIIAEKDEKINQLDVSIIGDLETITNLWLAEDVGEEVEFF